MQLSIFNCKFAIQEQEGDFRNSQLHFAQISLEKNWGIHLFFDADLRGRLTRGRVWDSAERHLGKVDFSVREHLLLEKLVGVIIYIEKWAISTWNTSSLAGEKSDVNAASVLSGLGHQALSPQLFDMR